MLRFLRCSAGYTASPGFDPLHAKVMPSRRLRAVLLSVLFPLVVLASSSAQTPSATLKPLGAFNQNISGMMQAGDGNFYTFTYTAGSPGTSTSNGCTDGTNHFCSAIYKMTPTGAVSVFHSFEVPPSGTNYDGEGVTSFIEAQDGNFYGTAAVGGAYKNGTIFKITKTGGLTVLYAFPADGSSGVSPSSLVEGKDGNFYGITLDAPYSLNGTYPGGTLFKMTPSGTFTLLHTFLRGQTVNNGINTEGYFPKNLIQGADGNFYGTTFSSNYLNGVTYPSAGFGTIFSMAPDGTVKTLYNLAADGSDGYYPSNPLVQGPDGNLYGSLDAYGTTADSHPLPYGVVGHQTYGSIYSISPSGTFRTAYSFQGGTNGDRPSVLMLGSDGSLYGGTAEGGNPANCYQTYNGCGVIFRLKRDGTEETLYSFLNGTDSAVPDGAMVQTTDGSLVGTTLRAGFQLTVTPSLQGAVQLTVSTAGTPLDTSVQIPANTPLTLSWNVLNAYSGTARNCHASVLGDPPGAGAWSGMQAGTVSASGYSGSATVTPTQPGTYVYALTCGGTESALTAPITVAGGPLKIVTTSLKDATVGVHYLQTLSATGGVTPYTWAVSGLPDGLTLDPNAGTISGIITKPPFPSTDFDLAITVTDSSSPQQNANATITLNVKDAVTIGAVEFTQSIQVFQTLDELKGSITAHGGPPMPMISGKPAVMRIYLTPVKAVSTVILQVTGSVNATRTWAQQPNCYPEDERSHAKSCPSIDLYFTPPSGTWSVDLLLTNVSGDQLQHETLTITSKDTRNIHLVGTSICDSYTVNFNTGGRLWSCGDPSVLIGKTSLMNMMMPADNVILDLSSDRVTDLAFPTGSPSQSQYGSWLATSVFHLGEIYTSRAAVNALLDLTNNTHTVRFGIYRHNLDGTSAKYDTGIADDIPGRGAMTADVVTRLNNVDALAEVVTHETGHTLGLMHTNLMVSPLDTTYPGCYNNALDDTTDWPPFITNNVQSTNGPEYPFNVTTHTLMDPVSTYELMSYCMPRWISPPRYATVTTALNGGSVAEPYLRSVAQAKSRSDSPARAQLTTVSGSYWEVSGVIGANGVTFAPVFQNTMQGMTDAGTGTYTIVAQDAQGSALYTRYFSPVVSKLENETGDAANDMSVTYFGESIPVTSGTASIVVKDSSGAIQSTVALSASAPAVTITSPGAGFTATGVQTIAWTATNPTNGTLTSRVLYSQDNGSTWSQMAQFQGNALDLDFNSLPGSSGAMALIKVLVSDGANTGSATSGAFTVAHKTPAKVVIISPISGAVVPTADTLQLVGFAYDVDDGMLTGSKLAWTSDLQGNLGTGSPLTASLVPGVHKLTLTATDSDGNAVSTLASVTIVGQGPSISLTSNVDSSSKCTTATVNASIGAMGANLSKVQYSLNGGQTYADIALSSLPYTFNIPGTGDIDIVARVYDVSGQSNAQSTDVTIATACAQSTLQAPVITWPTPSAISYGTALSGTQLNATASAPGTFSYSPAAGSLLSAGPQTITATFTPMDTANYAVATASVTLKVTQASTSTRVQLSSAAIAPGTAETITVTVVPATAGVPSGTVTYMDGANLLGTATLSGGVATFTTSTLASGTHNITANYSGDSNFVASSGTASIEVSAAPTTDFTFSATGSSQQTVASGSTAIFTFATSPTGTSYPGDLSFTVAGLPASTTATFSPATIASNGGTQTVTMTVQTARKARLENLASGSSILVCMVIPFVAGRRRYKASSGMKYLTLCLVPMLLSLVFVLAGCGSSTTKYTVTVTATAGNVQHSAVVFLATQ